MTVGMLPTFRTIALGESLTARHAHRGGGQRHGCVHVVPDSQRKGTFRSIIGLALSVVQKAGLWLGLR